MRKPRQEYLRAYQRGWVKARRQEWLSENGPCAQCGSRERLEVDHIDPADKVDHKVWSWSKSRMDAELAKCQVLCVVCHRKKTARDREPPHGSNARYTGAYKCRCQPCRDAHAAVAREYRERLKSCLI